MRQRVRALLATPRFTAVAVVTIAVLICGISTVFSLVSGVMLRALPYPDSRRLLVIESIDRRGNATALQRAALERLQQGSRLGFLVQDGNLLTRGLNYAASEPGTGVSGGLAF